MMIKRLKKILFLLKRRKYIFKRLLFRFIHIRYYIFGRPILLKKMQNDSRFQIGDSRRNKGILISLLRQPIKKYEIHKIKLKDIKRTWKRRITFLCDTPVYAYVSRNDEKSYREYVREHFKHSGFDEKTIQTIVDKDISNFNETIKQIQNYGYDIRNGAIILDQDNIILDGVHRSCILWSMYGPGHEVSVLKIYYH